MVATKRTEIEERELPRNLSVKEQEAIAGDLENLPEKPAGPVARQAPVKAEPGGTPLYYVNLDENGKPVGTLEPEPPKDPDQPYIAVEVIQPTSTVLATPSGAPLTDQMNPSHDHYDAGLEERNPRPKWDTKGEQATGGGAPKPPSETVPKASERFNNPGRNEAAKTKAPA